jgi:hypothetical protein
MNMKRLRSALLATAEHGPAPVDSPALPVVYTLALPRPTRANRDAGVVLPGTLGQRFFCSTLSQESQI